MNHKTVITKSVREAIDFYPGGLCFSELSGIPILVNQQMNTLIETLTGHTVLDAVTAWNELQAVSTKNGCIRLDKPWLKTEYFHDDENTLVFAFPDDHIWQFRKQLIADNGIIQIEAAEITQLYHISEELYNNNIRLKQMQKRQEKLLDDIVQINRDRELLRTKMRIHDDLGYCLVASKKALTSDEITDEVYSELLSGWEKAICGMTNVPKQNRDVSPEAELQKVAALVGCQIIFIGEQPKEKNALLLMYSAIREALTNAVRHAGANRLTVDIQREKQWYHVQISSNGRPADGEITESGGLKSLRRSLEAQGAKLSYLYQNGVVLVIDLPAQED